MKDLISKMRSERACWFGWAHFKHWLVRNGIIATPDSDVPKEWQDNFLKETR